MRLPYRGIGKLLIHRQSRGPGRLGELVIV